ncbi:phospholipase [Rhodohalobacter sp. SW132]|nr:phospholipase [Rhodohalobacter sp. SW132]
MFPFQTAAQSDFKELFEEKEYHSDEGDKLPYRLLLPEQFEDGKNYPLVLFLHGMGERGSDNEAQLTWGVEAFAKEDFRQEHPAIVIAPQAPDDDYWANLDWRNEGSGLMEKPTKPLQMAYDLVQQIADEMPVDKNRIYITGLSMGGFGTWDLITRYPDTFAAAMPVCGGGDPSKAHLIKDLPIWTFHGAQDNVVPVELSRDMVQAIREAGGTPGYTEYPHVDHFSWIPAYEDRFALEWLFEQKKSEL